MGLFGKIDNEINGKRILALCDRLADETDADEILIEFRKLGELLLVEE